MLRFHHCNSTRVSLGRGERNAQKFRKQPSQLAGTASRQSMEVMNSFEARITPEKQQVVQSRYSMSTRRENI